jgi:hypothetical protein
MKNAVLVLAALVFSGAAQAGDAGFDKVMNCMRSSVPPMLQAENFQIESTDKAGATRSLQGKFYAKRDGEKLRVKLYITGPSSVAKASYLVIEKQATSEDDMYVFLPSVNRVRHVTGAFANGSLLGTDFSYAEVKEISNAFSGADGQLEGTDKLDGHDVNVISLKPLATQKSPYKSVKAWVDQKSCFVVKAEFNTGNTVRKRLTVPFDHIKQSGKYWYLSQIGMEDLVKGSRTVMYLDGVDSSKDIPSSNFNPATFHLGH